jgi:hypothetical protein
MILALLSLAEFPIWRITAYRLSATVSYMKLQPPSGWLTISSVRKIRTAGAVPSDQSSLVLHSKQLAEKTLLIEVLSSTE